MKYKKTIIFSSIVTIFIVAGGLSIKTGFAEDTLSQTKVPFQLFVKENKMQDVSSYAVKEGSAPQISDYTNDLKSLKDKFNNSEVKPNITDLNLDKSSEKTLQDLIDKTYSLPHNYINNVAITGISNTKTGWGPIISFSVLDDTTNVKTYTFSSTIKDKKITHLTDIGDYNAKYWGGDITNDFDQTAMANATTLWQELIENNGIYNGSYELSNEVKKLKPYIKNGVIGGVYQTQFPMQVLINYYVGTKNSVEKVVITYDTNKNTITSIK